MSGSAECHLKYDNIASSMILDLPYDRCPFSFIIFLMLLSILNHSLQSLPLQRAFCSLSKTPTNAHI